VLAAITAPVFPAEMKAFDFPFGERFIAHPDDLGCVDDFDAGAIHASHARKRGFDVGLAPHQLNVELRRELFQRLSGAFHLHMRGVICTHRVQRDADHQSSTVTRCSPL
jgi:hypothetical protein